MDFPLNSFAICGFHDGIVRDGILPGGHHAGLYTALPQRLQGRSEPASTRRVHDDGVADLYKGAVATLEGFYASVRTA